MMDFVFLVGVEGSGHNMTRNILGEYLASDRVVDQGGWHSLLAGMNDPNRKLLLADAPKPLFRTVEFLETSENPIPDLAQRWAAESPAGREILCREAVTKVFETYQQQGKTHIFDSASFPYQNPRNTLRRPDVMWLREITKAIGVRSRWLVLDRDPKSLAWSGFRRKFTDDLHEQSRIVEDNLIYINSQLKVVGSEEYRVLRFEDFLANPQSYRAALAEWVGTSEDLLERGFDNLQVPTQKKDIPEESAALLDRFFTPERAIAWSDSFCDTTQRLKRAE